MLHQSITEVGAWLSNPKPSAFQDWALIRHRTGLRCHSLTCNLPLEHDSHKQSKNTFNLPLSSLTEEAPIKYNLVDRLHNSSSSSCIAHTLCDRVAHRLPRRSRTHPHHPLPQSPVASSARAALVSDLSLQSQCKQQPFGFLLVYRNSVALRLILLRPYLSEALHSYEIRL